MARCWLGKCKGFPLRRFPAIQVAFIRYERLIFVIGAIVEDEDVAQSDGDGRCGGVERFLPRLDSDCHPDDEEAGMVAGSLLPQLLKRNMTTVSRPDPAFQPCEMSVKIADLGNACWTVCAVSR